MSEAERPRKGRGSVHDEAAPSPWGLLGLVMLTLAGAGTLASLDGCKQDTLTADAAPIQPDAGGGRNCDAEPNEWRISDPGPSTLLDDAGTRMNLFSIWGTADRTKDPVEPVGAIFAVGSGGRALRYDPGTEAWVAEETGTDAMLTSVGGASPTDVWAAGFDGTVVHYDGTKWSDRSPPLSLFLTPDAGVPTGDAAVEARNNLWGIWVASKSVNNQRVTSAVWAVGDRGTVLYFKDNVWQAVPSNVEEKLAAVWGAQENQVFIVGDFGTVLSGGTTGLSKAQTGLDAALRGVWGRGANDVYAVGVDGTVLHKGSGGWSEIEGAPKQVLRSVWGPPNDRSLVYIVGWDGALIKLTGGPGFGAGGTFHSFNCVTLHRLESIWGTMLEVPDIPYTDAGVPVDAGDLDFGTKSIPSVWISGVSGTIIEGP